MAGTGAQEFEEFDRAAPGLWEIQASASAGADADADADAVEPRAPDEPEAPPGPSRAPSVPQSNDFEFQDGHPPRQGLNTPTLSPAEHVRDQQNRRDDKARTFILRAIVILYVVVTAAYFISGFIQIGGATAPGPGEAIFTALTGIVGIIIGHYFTPKK